MTLEREIASWRTTTDEVPWDAVRERRVLARLQAERRAAADRGRRRPLLLAATGIAAAVLIALGGFWIGGGSTQDSPGTMFTDDPVGAPADARAATGRFKFPDGSMATYLTPAVVEVEEQTTESIRLAHLHGKVRYQVEHLPGRAFVVNANGIEVQVVGTVFVVDVDFEEVHVRVDRGVVVVDSASGILELNDGEEIILACRDSAIPDPALDPQEADPPPSSKLAVRMAAAEGSGSRRDSRGTPSFDELLKEVDRARRAGDNDLAAATLRKMINLYPGNGRIVSALFTLGKVESQRGRYVDAARAYRRCWRSSPRGTLAEDAHFQEAISWDRIGRIREAQAAARRYLQAFPTGPYAERMRRIAQ